MSIPKINIEHFQNWSLYNDCVNITGELSESEILKITSINNIRMIQPRNFMPSEDTWLRLNSVLFSKKPNVILNIWADNINSDFIFISRMNNVRYLELNQVNFKNKDTLSELIKLKKLKIYNGNLNELSFLRLFQDLEILEFGRIKLLKDVSFISELTNLKKLVIEYQPNITELPNLEKLNNLNKLFLIKLKNLSNIKPISNLQNLEELGFNGLSSDLEPKNIKFLNNMPSLKKIRANFNSKQKNFEFKTLVKNAI